jgi:general secretion pathway protein M
MNLPRIAQRLIALGLLAVVVGLLLVVVIGSMDLLTAKREEIAEGRWTLARLDKLLTQGASMTSAGGHDFTDIATNPFLPGNSIPLIQANLQGRLNSIAAMQNASIISVGNVPALSIDGVQHVGVRADLQGSLEALYNTIFELETASPPLIVREAIIHSVGNPGGRSSGPIELVAQISVYGAIEINLESIDLQAANQ